MGAPIPEDEDERLDRLDSYDILDTVPEPIYEDLCYLASTICDTDIAAISLIDEDRSGSRPRRASTTRRPTATTPSAPTRSWTPTRR